MPDKNIKSRPISYGENFVLIGVLAIISRTVSAPVERVKLLVQTQRELLRSCKLAKPYRGVLDCAISTFRSEGIFPFWRGNVANCLRYVPTQALNFMFKDQIKAMLQEQKDHPYAGETVKLIFVENKDDSNAVKSAKIFACSAAAGSIAGVLPMCFVYSLDFSHTRLASDKIKEISGERTRQFNGLVDVYRKTIRRDGFASLYRGFVVSCVGVVIYRGFYFGLYDSLKPTFIGDSSNIAHSFLLGYFVTTAAGFISYPVDTVRRQMMMTSGENFKYRGSFHCAKAIFRDKGVLAFFKGSSANILRGVAGAMVFPGIEKLTEIYKNSFRFKDK